MESVREKIFYEAKLVETEEKVHYKTQTVYKTQTPDVARLTFEQTGDIVRTENEEINPKAVFTFVLPRKQERISYRESQSRIRRAVAQHKDLQHGLVLDTLEKGVHFPVLHLNFKPKLADNSKDEKSSDERTPHENSENPNNVKFPDEKSSNNKFGGSCPDLVISSSPQQNEKNQSNSNRLHPEENNCKARTIVNPEFSNYENHSDSATDLGIDRCTPTDLSSSNEFENSSPKIKQNSQFIDSGIQIDQNSKISPKTKLHTGVQSQSRWKKPKSFRRKPKIWTLLKEDALGENFTVQQGLYEELKRIEPDYAYSNRDDIDSRAFIILGYKSLDKHFSSVLESTWRDWTGARYIYLRMQNQYDLSKIVFYRKVRPSSNLDLFTYVVVVECWNVTPKNVIGILDFVQRIRVERLTGYISLYRDLGLEESSTIASSTLDSESLDSEEEDSQYHSGSQESLSSGQFPLLQNGFERRLRIEEGLAQQNQQHQQILRQRERRDEEKNQRRQIHRESVIIHTTET